MASKAKSKLTAFDLDPNLNSDPSGADAFTLAATEALVESNKSSDAPEVVSAAQKFPLLAAFPEFFHHLDRELDYSRNSALVLQLPEKHEAIVRSWYDEDYLGRTRAEIRDHSAGKTEVKIFDLAKYHLSESGCWYDIETGELMGYRGPNDEFLPVGVRFGDEFTIMNQITLQPIQVAEEFHLNTEEKVKWGLRKLLRIDTQLKALNLEQQAIIDNIDRQRKKLMSDRNGFMWKFGWDFEQYYNKAIAFIAKGKSIPLTFGTLKKAMKPASTKINPGKSALSVQYIKSRITEIEQIIASGAHDKEWTGFIEEALSMYRSALKVEESTLVSNIPDLDKRLGLLPIEVFSFRDKHEEFSVEIKVPEPAVAVIPE